MHHVAKSLCNSSHLKGCDVSVRGLVVSPSPACLGAKGGCSCREVGLVGLIFHLFWQEPFSFFFWKRFIYLNRGLIFYSLRENPLLLQRFIYLEEVFIFF